jgi:hypothetical protein
LARTFGQGTRALAEDKFQQTKRGDENHHERFLSFPQWIKLSPSEQEMAKETSQKVLL